MDDPLWETGVCSSAAAALPPAIDMAASVTPGIAAEMAVTVAPRSFSATRQAAVVATAHVIAVVDRAAESTRAVEPGAGSDEDAVREPLRSVVAIRRALIRRVTVISIRAHGRGADLDGNLGMRLGRVDRQQRAGNQKRAKEPEGAHLLTSLPWLESSRGGKGCARPAVGTQ